MSEVVIRNYKSHDAEGINAMFTKYLPYVRDEKFWVWLNRIIGGSSIAFVADYEGKIVGHYAVVPRDLFFNGRRLKAALGIHAFVDPEYRRQVFIYQITKKVYEVAANNGIQIIYGFPNANFRNIQLRIEGWKQVDLFKSYELDLSLQTNIILKEGLQIKRIEGTNYHELYNISELDDVKSSSVIFDSDVRYWLLRYILHPQHLYELYSLTKENRIIGFFITKEFRNENKNYFHLIDYKLDSLSYFSDLISAYIYLGESKQMDVLSVWQGDSEFKKEINKYGFEQKGFETFLGVKFLDKSIDNTEAILNINNWRLVMGDSDAF